MTASSATLLQEQRNYANKSLLRAASIWMPVPCSSHCSGNSQADETHAQRLPSLIFVYYVFMLEAQDLL